MIKFKKLSKRTWIEIAIAAVILTLELIGILVYRFGGYAGYEHRIAPREYEMLYVELYMSKVLYASLALNLMYVIVILIVHSKNDINTKILESLVAILLAVVEIIVIVYRADSIKGIVYPEYNAQEMAFAYALAPQINALYAIILQIAHSKKYLPCKIGIGVALPIIEFIVIWLCKYNVKISDAELYYPILARVAIFISAFVIYLVVLILIDSFHKKEVKQTSEETPITENSVLSDKSGNQV